MLFCPSKPLFSALSSTKSGFLCAFAVWNPCFLDFRAQNRGFCAFLPSGTAVFGLFEHKIGVFVRFGGATDGSNGGDDLEQREQREQRELQKLREQCEQLEQRQQQEQQERRTGQFGLLTFCHKGALFELWHSI